MNAPELLDHLQSLDVHVSVNGEKLTIDAPKGVVTADLRAELVAQKAALLMLLETRAVASHQETSCSQCTLEATSFSDEGEPFCQVHRYRVCNEQCKAHPSLAYVTEERFFSLDVHEIMAQLMEVKGPVALDLETTGFDAQQDRIVSIALGTPGKVFILDFRSYYSLTQERQEAWHRCVKVLLSEPGRTWVGHNLKFDWKFLSEHLDVRLKHVYDTMLVEQLIHGIGLHDTDVSVNLRQTAARYGLSVSKEQRSWFPKLHQRSNEWNAPFPAEQLAYMVQDIEVPAQIARLQRERIKASRLEKVVQIEHEALPAIAAMELRGVRIDQTLWRTMLQKKLERQQALEQQLIITLGQARDRLLKRNYETQVEACTGYQKAIQAEEYRLMQCYQATPQQRSWTAFRQQELARWKQAHPQPVKPKQPDGVINLASATQLQQALGALGVQVNSTQEAALEPYAKTQPVIADLLHWKKLQKFRSAFGENLLAMIGPDGRLRADYAQIGAVSGRIICRSPNLQQIPAKEKNEEENLRRCFIAPPGCSILKADLSNIELRILAEVSRDETMLRLFAEGKDLHAETAKLMFNLPPETDTKKHLYKGQISVRDVAKTINFGLAYGMGAQGLANRVGVSVEVSRELMKTYFTTYAGVARWLRITAQQAMKQGYAVTLAGRRRTFLTTITDPGMRGSMERSAKNHPIQGTNADILKRALALLHASLPEGVHVILCVHDEIVLECPDALREEATQTLKRAMTEACCDFLKVVHIPETEVLEGRYWKKD